MPKKILLLGPPYNSAFGKAYGGGVGGYTRKMQLYIEHFPSQKFEQLPCFQTVRGQKIPFGFVGRFFIDIYRFVWCLLSNNVSGIHMLGQYRGAIPREFCLAFLSKMWAKPYVYEIKAGVFINWYEKTSRLNRFMIRYVLKKASAILGQGQPYINFLQKEFGLEGIYFPNFVASTELQAFRKRRIKHTGLNILFVGFAFKDKGVFELVEACRELAGSYPIQLTMVGKEHPEFASWVDNLPQTPSFILKRLGRLPHEEVLKIYAENELYCYPTKHAGEGHNNTINEAMMSGLVVITTKEGFLESIIGSERGYLLKECSVASIKDAIVQVLSHQNEAIQKTIKARQYLEENFLDHVAFIKLEAVYDEMVG